MVVSYTVACFIIHIIDLLGHPEENQLRTILLMYIRGRKGFII